MSRSSRVYLDDILQAISDIRGFTEGMDRQQFMEDVNLHLGRSFRSRGGSVLAV